MLLGSCWHDAAVLSCFCCLLQVQQQDCFGKAFGTAQIMGAAGIPVGFFRAHVTLKV